MHGRGALSTTSAGVVSATLGGIQRHRSSRGQPQAAWGRRPELRTYLTATWAAVWRRLREGAARWQGQPDKAAGVADAALPVYSPTDLAVYMESPFAAWMERLLKERPEDPRCSFAQPHPTSWLFAPRGLRVEERLLAWLRAAHPGLKVADLSGARFKAQSAAAATNDWRARATEMTMEALKDADVLYQAPLYHARLGLYGIADFIVNGRLLGGQDGYAIWDTKLALHPQPHFLVQLGAYAEALQEMLGSTGAVRSLALVLGEAAADCGEATEVPQDVVRQCFRKLWPRFRDFQNSFTPDGAPPDPADSPAVHWGRWGAYAEHILAEADDLMQVAGITRLQRSRLRMYGCSTMQSLASMPMAQIQWIAKAANISMPTLRRLRLQADLQKTKLKSGRPASRLLETARTALAGLPPDDEGDVFLDFEGLPLPSRQYLLGAVTSDGVYHDWWAPEAHAELDATRGLLAWLRARRKRHPGMHVYHYGHYEVTFLRQLTSAMGPRDEMAQCFQDMLNDGVFVDLYALVRRSLAIGAPGYGLKNLERLYSKTSRGGAVTEAAGCLALYFSWLENPDGSDWHESAKLRAIRDYNRCDCESTRELLVWLRKRCARLISQLTAGDVVAPRPREARASPKLVDILEPAKDIEDLGAAELAAPGSGPRRDEEMHKVLNALVRKLAALPDPSEDPAWP